MPAIKSTDTGPIPGRPSQAHENGRVPELDGIRGLAIFGVMLFHFGAYTSVHPSRADSVILGILGFGWAGVDLFFVLSGYLITGILLDSRGASNYFSSFYMRRVLRILPLYYASVLVFFCAIPLLAPYLHFAAPEISSTEQVWYWLHISNLRTAFYPLLYPRVTHFWSLAIEEQFYLVWPVIVLFCSRRKILVVSASLVLLCFGLRNLEVFQRIGAHYPNFLYRLTPFRIDSLAFGACGAIAMRDTVMRAFLRRWGTTLFWAGFASCALVVAVAQTTSAFSQPMTRFGYSSLGVTFGAAIVYTATRAGCRGPIHRILRSRVLTTWGKYSYGMYIFHAPIALWVVKYLPHKTNPLAAAVVVVVGIGLTQLVALCSWYCLELRFLKLKNRFRSLPAS
jgi:peptidoglycan/LPS O-acetylase OafA/YrhL